MKNLLTLLLIFCLAWVGQSNSMAMDPLNLSEINQVDFPDEQYVNHETEKSQIILHHTASGQKIDGDIAHWKGTKSRIATHVIISRDGTINQLYSSKYWAFALGIKKSQFTKLGLPYKNLDKQAIQVELDSWGDLRYKNGKYYAWPRDYSSSEVEAENVITYDTPFRGIKHYERYTQAQIDSCGKLLQYWKERYGIPLGNLDLFGLSNDALSGVPGVYSHANYRADKRDCHPQPELIEMLASL